MPTIHNKSKSRIVYPIVWDEEGKPVIDAKSGLPLSDEILPGQHKSISDEIYNHLKSSVPNHIINIDDVTDLQNNIGGVAAGYVSAHDVERIRREAFDAGVKSAGGIVTENKIAAESLVDDSTDKELAETINAMDRATLIAFIESNDLKIDHTKLKHPTALKNAVLEAYKSTVQKAPDAA